MAKNDLFGVFSSLTVITVIFVCSSVTSLKVTVYYEALCYDSIKFIGQQLSPHWPAISPYIELELVPYGKALHKLDGEKYNFFCQHGPKECEGNKYQACLLSQNLGKDKDVPLIRCIMSGSNPASLIQVKDCARQLGYNLHNLNTCVETNEADRLLAQHGDKTWRLEPNISFVPTIVFDDQFSKTDTDQARIDFVAVVCSKLKHKRPDICTGKQLPTVEEFNPFLP